MLYGFIPLDIIASFFILVAALVVIFLVLDRLFPNPDPDHIPFTVKTKDKDQN